MSVNDGASVSRSFVANPVPWGARVAARHNNKSIARRLIFLFVVVAAMATLALGPQLLPKGSLKGFWSFVAHYHGFLYPIPFLGIVGYLVFRVCVSRYNRRRIDISVTGDRLTTSMRPRDAFSLTDAKLGAWCGPLTQRATWGTVLHLRSGRHEFRIGGRDHRIADGTRLDAPPTDFLDVWMPASDFDEVLGMARRWNGF